MKNEQDIPDLLERLKSSDYQAFSCIFSIYHQQIYFFCKKTLPEEEAEEIVQNVFMIVWENRKQIDLQRSFSSYLYSIARHQVYNMLRSKVIQKSFIEKYIKNTENMAFPHEFDDDAKKLKEKLRRTVQQLPERQREIFILSRTYKLTYKEIAEKLSISENTVDTSIRRSLDTLRRIFRQLVLLLFC